MSGVGCWLKKQAILRGDKPALVCGDIQLSYRELNKRVNRLAWVLKEPFSLKKGDRVAYLGFNSPEFAEVFFATAKLGLLLVPLNVRLAVRELQFMLTDSGAKLLFLDSELAENSGVLGAFCPQGLVLFGDYGQYHNLYGELLAKGTETEPAECETVSLEEEHLILYTSGTTGLPKGAVLTHGNAFWNTVNMQETADLTSQDVTLTALPHFHTGGIGLYLVPTLHQGGTVVIQRKFSATETFSLLKKYRVTAFFGVPAMFQALLELPDFNAGNLPALRGIMSGGAPLPPVLIERYRERGLTLQQGYGCTETSPGIMALAKEAVFAKAGSVGKPLLHCRVRLVLEDGSEADCGEVGEIWVKGGNVMKGYWRQEKATAEALADGWFKTGDLARRDEDDFYFIAGRKKDMIISGGENIYPAEVENYLLQHAGVSDAAVFGIPDERWGEVPAAVVVAADPAVTAQELTAFCLKGLARYKVPTKIVIKSILPRNAAGKLQKQDLRAEVRAALNGGD
jgi:fatty-acyl-CoA synthase